ncbi:hypothetical protein D3C80_1606530 [compost metagenome]
MINCESTATIPILAARRSMAVLITPKIFPIFSPPCSANMPVANNIVNDVRACAARMLKWKWLSSWKKPRPSKPVPFAIACRYITLSAWWSRKFLKPLM